MLDDKAKSLCLTKNHAMKTYLIIITEQLLHFAEKKCIF